MKKQIDLKQRQQKAKILKVLRIKIFQNGLKKFHIDVVNWLLTKNQLTR
jgi:hypothetical protein